ncbi:MAG: glycosyltransferase family 39 protein [Bryobacteraceae bacterium]|nr:glycosyltransferase family 39 protein [Bryobacteraceae bacterium]
MSPVRIRSPAPSSFTILPHPKRYTPAVYPSHIGLKTLFAISSVIVLLSRLSHHQLVWVEEAYGLAAAAEVLRGRNLYSDIWFDKPPVYAWFYMLNGAHAGWSLRLLDTAFVIATACCVGLLARQFWGDEEGWIAASLICFSLTFWIPASVMAITPDQLVLVPFTLALLFAVQKRPLLAGALVGAAVLCNSKGLLALPAVLLWTWRQWQVTLAGFSAVTAAHVAVVPVGPYWQEVWIWGARYSGDTFLQNPLVEGVRRTASWAGFHMTLVTAAAWCLRRGEAARLGLVVVICFASVVAGLRFFPRYYFFLLPPLAVLAARGLTLLPARFCVGVVLLLFIPLVRFAPRYFSQKNWSDTVLMSDSSAASQLMLKYRTKPKPSLLVWGYRPEVFVFSGLPAATRFLDSQPLTGVLADRHLITSKVTYPEIASGNRRELINSKPDFIVDGLGLLNPALAISSYGDLEMWLRHYKVVGETRTSIVYQRNPE